jgi:hypothetical protein
MGLSILSITWLIDGGFQAHMISMNGLFTDTVISTAFLLNAMPLYSSHSEAPLMFLSSPFRVYPCVRCGSVSSPESHSRGCYFWHVPHTPPLFISWVHEDQTLFHSVVAYGGHQWGSSQTARSRLGIVVCLRVAGFSKHRIGLCSLALLEVQMILFTGKAVLACARQ